MRSLVVAMAAAVAVAASAPAARAQAVALRSGRAPIAGGVYRAVTAKAGDPAQVVAPFALDRTPITNADFLAFVIEHRQWRRDRVPAPLAAAGYLSRWASAVDPGPDAPARAPVVEVSWFAARAFCAARGAQLPTEGQWELAAAASPASRDGRRDPEWRQRVLAWYERPNPPRLPDVGAGVANIYGVHDLHGLVWEWVEDFGASMLVGADARLCGSGAVAVADPLDYPAFLRAAFRSSVSARSSLPNLGFRCASAPAATGTETEGAP